MAVHLFRFENGDVYRCDCSSKTEAIRRFINAKMSEWAEDHAYDCDDHGTEFLLKREEFLKIIRNAKYETWS